MWTEHTEYEEYQSLQLSTAVRYQHNNDKISSNYWKKINNSISHTPIQKIYVRPFVLPLRNEEEAESNDFSDEMKCGDIWKSGIWGCKEI